MHYIDLVYLTETGSYLWGDGSELDQSIVNPNEPLENDDEGNDFVIFSNELHDIISTNAAQCLCQNYQFDM